jgi:hypothetical protein
MIFRKRKKAKRSKPKPERAQHINPPGKPEQFGWAEHDRLQVLSFWNNPTGLR